MRWKHGHGGNARKRSGRGSTFNDNDRVLRPIEVDTVLFGVFDVEASARNFSAVFGDDPHPDGSRVGTAPGSE